MIDDASPGNRVQRHWPVGSCATCVVRAKEQPASPLVAVRDGARPLTRCTTCSGRLRWSSPDRPLQHDVISNASCTTNCAAPMAQVLDACFGIESGLLTTVHSYTADQNLLDGPHKDLRRARSAAVNIIPTSTGAAKAVGLVLPQLAGRLDGVAVRVPVVDASLVDLTVQLTEPATAAQVNAAFHTAAEAQLKGILRCTEEPVVSHDVIGENASCLLDTGLTRVAGRMVKVFGWYDNEWGYAQRTVDLVEMVARLLPAR